jgi:predicted AAA+ superfamily ATPase
MLGRGMVIALTGQRRVGKSYTMKAVIEEKRRDANANIIYIDKERTEFDDIVTYKDLESYVKERLTPEKDNYLFIDEVQEIEAFEKTVLDLQAGGLCEIMLTGSNAKMLSGELSTRLRGRYIDYRIRGLSYLEFLRFHDLEDNDDSLGLYLQNGGLPGLRLMELENPDLVRDYLMNVYNTILLRDIIEREKIRNIPLLKTLIRFLSDNIGKQFSARSIANFLKSQNTDATTNIILSYLEYLCNAYIIDRVERYNIHGKKILEFDDKFYFEDLGIRNIIIGSNRKFDIEKMMEDAVYKHLARLGYTVYVGQLQKAEIDFVAENAEGTIYVQVTYLLASEETVNREFGNLKQIRDNHPKYVVSMDRTYGQTNVDGIKHVHLRDFLKMNFF